MKTTQILFFALFLFSVNCFSQLVVKCNYIKSYSYNNGVEKLVYSNSTAVTITVNFEKTLVTVKDYISTLKFFIEENMTNKIKNINQTKLIDNYGYKGVNQFGDIATVNIIPEENIVMIVQVDNNLNVTKNTYTIEKILGDF